MASEELYGYHRMGSSKVELNSLVVVEARPDLYRRIAHEEWVLEQKKFLLSPEDWAFRKDAIEQAKNFSMTNRGPRGVLISKQPLGSLPQLIRFNPYNGLFFNVIGFDIFGVVSAPLDESSVSLYVPVYVNRMFDGCRLYFGSVRDHSSAEYYVYESPSLGEKGALVEFGECSATERTFRCELDLEFSETYVVELVYFDERYQSWGGANLTVMASGESLRRRERVQLSRHLRSDLDELRLWLEGSFSSLNNRVMPGGTAVDARQVGVILSELESRISDILKVETFAGMRPYVAERLEEIRSFLGSRRFAVPEGQQQSSREVRIVLVANDESEETGSSSHWLWLEARYEFETMVLDLIERLRNVTSRIAVDLRVTSSPPGARVVIFPKGYRDGSRETTTDDSLENVYRGIYIVTLSMDGYTDHQLEIDLIDDFGDELECVLSVEEGGACRLKKSRSGR